MFNPFHPFTPELLHGMTSQGIRYFVRQSFGGVLSVFSNGRRPGKSYLFTHYDSVVTAQDHYGAIAHDPNRFLYDWENPEHQLRLTRATHLCGEFRLYGAVLRRDWERLITDSMRESIKRYIATLNWQPTRADTVHFTFELRFGELYAVIRYGKRKTTAKFEDIENIAVCATTSPSPPPLKR